MKEVSQKLLGKLRNYPDSEWVRVTERGAFPPGTTLAHARHQYRWPWADPRPKFIQVGWRYHTYKKEKKVQGYEIENGVYVLKRRPFEDEGYQDAFV